MNNKRVKEVQETKYGVYVWEMPDGKWVGDDEGHYMLVPATQGDKDSIKAITDAAKSYGIEEGGPVFLAGRRKVTDEEYSLQETRLKLGLTPDPYDIGEGLDLQRKLIHGR
jgi:hypothetical protein